MNRLNRRMYALLVTVVVATNAAYGMEAEVVNTVSVAQQNEVAVATTAWYRKRSTQVMAAVVTGAAIVYTVAAYMNKVLSPVELWKNLFMPALPQTSSQNTNSTNTTTTSTTDVDNDGNNSTTDAQGTNDESTINNADVVTADKQQTEVVVTKNAAFAKAQENLRMFAKKLAEYKTEGSKKFRESFDAWNRSEE
jgi:hypothetical protein